MMGNDPFDCVSYFYSIGIRTNLYLHQTLTPWIGPT
jgi:hypothetical protein